MVTSPIQLLSPPLSSTLSPHLGSSTHSGLHVHCYWYSQFCKAGNFYYIFQARTATAISPSAAVAGGEYGKSEQLPKEGLGIALSPSVISELKKKVSSSRKWLRYNVTWPAAATLFLRLYARAAAAAKRQQSPFLWSKACSSCHAEGVHHTTTDQELTTWMGDWSPTRAFVVEVRITKGFCKLYEAWQFPVLRTPSFSLLTFFYHCGR